MEISYWCYLGQWLRDKNGFYFIFIVIVINIIIVHWSRGLKFASQEAGLCFLGCRSCTF